MDVSSGNMSVAPDASSILGHFSTSGDDLFPNSQLNQTLNCGDDDFDELLRHIGYSDLNAIESSELFNLSLNPTEDSLLLDTDLKNLSTVNTGDVHTKLDNEMDMVIMSDQSALSSQQSLSSVAIDRSKHDDMNMQMDTNPSPIMVYINALDQFSF